MKRGFWRFEFKVEDAWVGAFWKHQPWTNGGFERFDLWVCLLPCVPLHVWWIR
jgi:hypothetical protein